MKATIILVLIFCCFSFSYSQDLIIKKSGEEIECYIMNTENDKVLYSLDSLNKFKYLIPQSDVFMIKYNDGLKELFGENKIGELPSDYCTVGQYDAKKFYKKSMATSLVPTILFAPAGLITAIVSSSRRPKEEHIITDKPDMLNNIQYKDCYLKEARSIKSRKVWIGFGVGMGINLAVWAILVSNSQ